MTEAEELEGVGEGVDGLVWPPSDALSNGGDFRGLNKL